MMAINLTFVVLVEQFESSAALPLRSEYRAGSSPDGANDVAHVASPALPHLVAINT